MCQKHNAIPADPPEYIFEYLAPKPILDIRHVFSTDFITDETQFGEACIDTVAQQSVFSHAQAKSYALLFGGRTIETQKPVWSRVSNGCFPCLGSTSMHFPTPDYSFLLFKFDIVQPDVPLLLAWGLLEKYKFVAGNVEKRIPTNFRAGWCE